MTDANFTAGRIKPQVLTTTAINATTVLVDDTVALVDDPNTLVGSQVTPTGEIKTRAKYTIPRGKIISRR